MIIGILREEKIPHDWRVALSPKQCRKIMDTHNNIEIIVQTSQIRCFSDQAYIDQNIKVQEDLSHCDVLIGIKEVSVSKLIPNKKYFFFSHTIKKQKHNQNLLKQIIANNIELYDWELIKKNGQRLIFFGRWAGIVGAYNTIRTIGLKFREFELPRAVELGRKSKIEEILSQIELPNVKILLTGQGHVATGAREILESAQIKEVTRDEFLNKEFKEAVFLNIGCEDYVSPIDNSAFDLKHFFANPKLYKSTFEPYTKVTDVLISGHYWDSSSPRFWDLKDMESEDFKISVIGDITCDIDGSIPSTIRSSSIANPNYGFSIDRGEVDMLDDDAIAVMAVDNLPCELSKDSSEDFGKMFIKHVLPNFFNNDKDQVLHNARMTQGGKLCEKYNYLQDYVEI